jgi:hypothetical protein
MVPAAARRRPFATACKRPVVRKAATREAVGDIGKFLRAMRRMIHAPHHHDFAVSGLSANFASSS